MRPLFVLTLLAAPAWAQRVDGSVINSVTGSGIPGARVVIVGTDRATRLGRSANADAQGHFAIDGIPPGTYAASYSSSGYQPADPAPRWFQMTASGNPVHVEGRLTPLPKISGRVVDGRGQPVPQARVELNEAGAPHTTTDAGGKFEMVVRPGSHTLSVVPPVRWKPPDPEPDSGRALAWTRTDYPGRLVTRPGSEVAGIEIKLRAVPTHAVRGVLLNAEGAPAPKIAIRLADDARSKTPFRVESDDAGEFEFPTVTEGEWRLFAEVEKQHAKQWIDVARRELDPVKLRLTPPFAVSGKVVIEAPEGATPLTAPAVSLVPHAGPVRKGIGMASWMLAPNMNGEPVADRVAGQIHAQVLTMLLTEEGGIIARPDAAGNFSLPNVYPGTYRILPVPIPPPAYYLDAVRLGEVDVAASEVEVASGAPPITIVYKPNGGTVRGTAEKCGSGRVWLVPQDAARQWLGFLRVVPCDANDRYEISAVRPGAYYALALAGDGPLPGIDPALLAQATKVTVRAGESSSADLRVIAAEY